MISMDMHTGKTGYYDAAAAVLPQRLQKAISFLTYDQRQNAEEIRLKVGNFIYIHTAESEIVAEYTVTSEDIESVINIATGASAYAAKDSFKRGFFTAAGGVRIGICGQAVCENGEISTFRDINSLNIRIPHEVKGIGKMAAAFICAGGAPVSCIIVSPPGGGKTTLLRDTVRTLSDEYMLRVGVCDERGEIAPYSQKCQVYDVGRRTDICSGCRKKDAAMILLRGMNPRVLALDEITENDDTQAVISASNCGAAVLATAHGAGIEDLYRRDVYKKLTDDGAFSKAVVIKTENGHRKYEYINL